MAASVMVWRSTCRTTATADLITKFGFGSRTDEGNSKKMCSFAAQLVFLGALILS